MKNTYSFFTLTIFVLAVGLHVSAQCPSANDSLDVNQVNALLLNGGAMHWDYNLGRYEVPKGSGINSGGPLALWFAGVDDQGQLRLAAQTYRQSGSDFHTGPIDPNTDDQGALCEQYDRFWKVAASEIEEFKSNFTNGNISGIDDVPTSIQEWPGRNSNYGDFLIGDLDVAPFVDANNDGNYDPLTGDYPKIRGDQAVWWVYNDRKIHEETTGEPLDIQVSVLAYSFIDSPLDYTTFYQYEFLNAGSHHLQDFRVGQWFNPNFGCWTNDYVGCQPEENLVFVYNAELESSHCSFGHGDSWPILGMKFINGLTGNDGEELNMSSFLVHGKTGTNGAPFYPEHFYRFMKAQWRDGTHLTFGGNGYGGSEISNFMYPSNPSESGTEADGFWSECSVGNEPWDRRFVAGFGGIDFPPGAKNSLTVAMVWDDSNSGPCPDISLFNAHVNQIKDIHDQLIVSDLTGVSESPFEQSLQLFPNPMQTSATLHWDGETENPNHVEMVDLSGQVIMQKKIPNTNHCIIERSSLQSGLYFFKLMNDNKLLATGKLIVE